MHKRSNILKDLLLRQNINYSNFFLPNLNWFLSVYFLLLFNTIQLEKQNKLIGERKRQNADLIYSNFYLILPIAIGDFLFCISRTIHIFI